MKWPIFIFHMKKFKCCKKFFHNFAIKHIQRTKYTMVSKFTQSVWFIYTLCFKLIIFQRFDFLNRILIWISIIKLLLEQNVLFREILKPSFHLPTWCQEDFSISSYSTVQFITCHLSKWRRLYSMLLFFRLQSNMLFPSLNNHIYLTQIQNLKIDQP